MKIKKIAVYVEIPTDGFLEVFQNFDALRGLVPIVHFKKCEKHPWRKKPWR